jgi:hypothetical protein
MPARLSQTRPPSGETGKGRRRIGVIAAYVGEGCWSRAIEIGLTAKSAPASFRRISRIVAPSSNP